MAKQRMQSVQEAEADSAENRGKSAAKRKPGGSWLFWLGSRLLVVFILLGVLGFFVPPLIGSTGLWKTLLATFAPQVANLIDAQGLQLAWLSPMEVRGLVVRDPAGEPLAEVPLIRSQKTLLAIALNYRDLGVFEVQEPKVKLVLRADGSNVEDLLAKLPKSESKSSASVGVGLILTKGLVQLDDQVAGRQWLLEGLGVEVIVPAAADQPKTGKIAGVVRPLAGDSATGQLGIAFSWLPGAAEKSPLGTGQAEVTLQSLPTEMAEGGLRRFVSDIRPRGPLTLQSKAAWRDDGSMQFVLSQLATPAISIAAPELLSSDQPTIAITAAAADIQLVGGQATVQNLQLQSNLISIAGKGAAAVSGLAGGNVELAGQINLAELARQLPATLHLKQDTQVTSGIVDLSLVSRAEVGARRFQGSVKTRDLRGVAAGRVIEFDQPLAIDFSIQQTASGPVIEQLVGQSSFLNLNGRGSLDEGSITASADLARLASEVGRLVDLSQARLAGTLGADLRWKHAAATGWNATAEAHVENFEASAAGLAAWKEPRLQLAASLQGELAGGELAQINAAKLEIEAGADQFTANLTQPVKSPSAASVWPVKFELVGDLASWSPRIQPFVALGGWRMAGAITATGSGRISPAETELGPTTLQINELKLANFAAGPDGSPRESLAIHEPVVKVETSGAWSQAKTTLTLGSTTFASSAIAFRADGVRVVAGKEPSVVGLIDFRGDLARLSSWLPTGGQPRTSQMTGGLVGRVEIGYRGQQLAANWSAEADNFVLLTAPPPPKPGVRNTMASNNANWQPLWQEPKITFAGQGTYDPAGQALRIERTNLALASGTLAAAGTLTKLTSPAPEIDLQGELAYDLGQITQQIQAHVQRTAQPGAAGLPYGLTTLQLTGQERRQFVLKGPLLAATTKLTPPGAPSTHAANPSPGVGVQISEALAGEASLGWQGAQYVGLVAGPADFRAKLAGGVVQVGPLDIPLSEGRLTTAPRVLLNNSASAVVVDRGPVLQNVRISPEMCSLWLKFVAPLVAEATRAEGKFSLSLEGANVPLAMPLASDVAGTLAIESAQIGPGPLAQQYLGVARQLLAFFESAGGNSAADDPNRGWLILPQQDVQFEVRDGLVTNRGLKMSVKNLVISTEGTVNIQTQQINLLATIPLPDSLFKKQDSFLASLKGQTVQIPITGTLSQPKLDTRIVENLGKQIAGSAVQGAFNKGLEKGQGLLNKELQKGEGILQGELGQGLRNLFGPKPQQPAGPGPR